MPTWESGSVKRGEGFDRVLSLLEGNGLHLSHVIRRNKAYKYDYME